MKAGNGLPWFVGISLLNTAMGAIRTRLAHQITAMALYEWLRVCHHLDRSG